ncbi:Hypothetical protein LUCI_3064 [Lucifera butyrica]|uniref:HotDog ACOT-type domain-containing protein n=1 Tax=Lucifera butyrica TaxID=1351585 RepID=A0A498R9F2_9FIRM|nr:acyl-CoA thioesterase [Lucifera butyrica]VBB07799.1 Hypothetical protein LUCI_3064 [Lucifera butyrica]
MHTKTVQHSKVTMSTVMLPQHANPAGNVHGGEIMKLMDDAAGVVARRHARTNVVTACVDELQFHHPILIGNVVTCHGQLTFVGKSSMEISITVTVEDLSQEEPAKTALTAFFTFVSLDEAGRPHPVPVLEITTDEERCLFERGRQRYLSRKHQEDKPACTTLK